jgi:hypothetical protein
MDPSWDAIAGIEGVPNGRLTGSGIYTVDRAGEWTLTCAAVNGNIPGSSMYQKRDGFKMLYASECSSTRLEVRNLIES